MRTVELHYSAIRLWMMAAAGLALAVLSLWIALDPTVMNAEGDGRADRITSIVGPQAARWFIVGAGLLIAAALLMSLRLFAVDRLALRADPRQLTLRGLFGTWTYTWSEVKELDLHRVNASGVTQKLIMVRLRAGRAKGIMVSLLRGGAAGAEAWTREAEKLLRAAQGRGPD